MDRNVITLNPNDYDNVINVIKQAKENNAVTLTLFEYLSSSTDRVCATIEYKDKMDYITIRETED